MASLGGGLNTLLIAVFIVLAVVEVAPMIFGGLANESFIANTPVWFRVLVGLGAGFGLVMIVLKATGISVGRR